MVNTGPRPQSKREKALRKKYGKKLIKFIEKILGRKNSE